MSLQSKKTNPAIPSPIILGIILLSLAYWTYLAITTRMEIVYDSLSYEALGRMVQAHGWASYFVTGPNREPFYPFLVSVSMGIEHITGMAYSRVIACVGVILLLSTQVLTYKILERLKISTGICAVVLIYLAISPALNNAAFSLYSEIAAVPLILGIILTSSNAWEAIAHKNTPAALIAGALLGILLTLVTLTKAGFECITPIYLTIFFMTIFLTEKKKGMLSLFLCLMAVLSFFYVPITGYKCLNQRYNGNFAITNRASWALYGNTARRMEPLTFKRFAEALAFVPGEGVCNNIFGSNACDFWSYRESDKLGYDVQGRLNSQALIKASTQKAFQNPFQYTLLTMLEGLKMFFWESTQIGFVIYPHWLQKTYDIKILNNGLRFLMSVVSLAAVLNLWFYSRAPQRSPVAFLMGILIFLYILSFSFFFILSRYALPIVPLYLICIGIWLDQNLAPKNKN